MPRGKETVGDLIAYLQGLVEMDPAIDGYHVTMAGWPGECALWNGKIATHDSTVELETDT